MWVPCPSCREKTTKLFHLFICLSVCPFIHLSLHQSGWPATQPSIRPSVCLSIHHSGQATIHPFICQSIHLSIHHLSTIHLFIHTFVHLPSSIHPSIYFHIHLAICPSSIHPSSIFFYYPSKLLFILSSIHLSSIPTSEPASSCTDKRGKEGGAVICELGLTPRT